MELLLSEMRKIDDFQGLGEMWQSTFVTTANQDTEYEEVEKQAKDIARQLFPKEYGEGIAYNGYKKEVPIGYALNMLMGVWQITLYSKKPHRVFKYPEKE